MAQQEQHGINWRDEKLVEHQKSIYNQIITNIIEPIPEKKKFAKEGKQKLGLVIVEPREHEWLKGTLYNMAHVYGGQDVVLYIIHGIKNEDFVKNIVDDEWSNVNFLKLPIENINRDDYNRLLSNSQFWSYFNTEYVLIFQTDTFIRKQIPDVFFLYDYIGSPWAWFPNGIKRRVGNGGFSLRKVSKMKEICNKYNFNPEQEEAEDVFFCKYIETDLVPPPSLASIFAVEHIYYPDPIGLHSIWRFQTINNIINWMSNIGGVPTLNVAS